MRVMKNKDRLKEWLFVTIGMIIGVSLESLIVYASMTGKWFSTITPITELWGGLYGLASGIVLLFIAKKFSQSKIS